MALESENGTGMVMPVSPMGGGFGNEGFGGNGWWWIILLFVLLGGWGNGFGNVGAGNPYVNPGYTVQQGFDQAAIMNGINGINSGLCSGFAGTQMAIANGFAQAEIAANSRQMADMNQNFAMQSALQNCCCENRAGLADVKYTIATENCADRAAISDGIRDIIVAQNANTQKILDEMCSDRISRKDERIADLERQLTLANLAASQGAQTAAILANNEAQTTALEQYLAPIPRPAYIVQNPACCNQNFGYGCAA